MRPHLIALGVALLLVSASAAALEAVTAFFGVSGPAITSHVTRAWLDLPLPDCGGGRLQRSEKR